MTKLGLRDSVLTLTLIPTVIIGLLLGGYFTVNRYIELDEILYQQGATISEPLAIALEQPLLDKHKVLRQRAVNRQPGYRSANSYSMSALSYNLPKTSFDHLILFLNLLTSF